jgi:tetratricopeptide (TPR) repeat protein
MPNDALTAYQKAAAQQRRLGDRSREAMALDGTGASYQLLGRHEEAADFHRQAVATHRELGNAWQLATALENLSNALDASGLSPEAADLRREILAIPVEHGDQAAAGLHARVRAAVAARQQNDPG